MTSPTRSNIESDLPRWGSANRDEKAFVILQALRRYRPGDLSRTQWLDLGCGSGGISQAIASKVGAITGVDPEAWPNWSHYESTHNNLRFITESVENLSISENRIDIAVCNQVYEHVDNPRLLIEQIYRVLKPGGFCYFAGPNLLFPIEPHVFWPFIHWLPRKFAVRLMRAFGAKNVVDAYSTTYWTLRKWLGKFEIRDVVSEMIANPDYYHRHGIFWTILSKIPASVLRSLTWMSPGLVFILRKPLAPNYNRTKLRTLALRDAH